MVISGTLGGLQANVALSPGALTVGLGDELVLAWDRGGRLYSFVDGERTFRRALNGRMLVKSRKDGQRERYWASLQESAAVVERAAALAADVLSSSLLGGVEDVGRGLPAPREVEGSLAVHAAQIVARAARFDSSAAAADAQAFNSIYKPIGILPPDQYLSLVVQATEGCSFGSCTFCSFYEDPYRVKQVAEFRAHVDAVRSFMGDSLLLRRRSVFLGSANALAVPMQGLLPLMDVLRNQFSNVPVCAFLDGFTGTMKSADDYALLGERGLSRVYVGLESGHDPLLHFVRKPASWSQAVETVLALKAARVAVGVIVMVGLGGDRFAEPHVIDTARALNAMDLGVGDLVYFSELVQSADGGYAQQVADAGIRPLTAAELASQRDAIARRLDFTHGDPKLATYDIREFVY